VCIKIAFGLYVSQANHQLMMYCLLLLLQIFGATDEDVDKLRIVSLHEMDMDRLESMMTGAESSAAESAADQQQGSSSSGTEEKK
jgi:hypothetical protein